MRISKENRILLDLTLGDYLKKLRESRNYSQKELSKLLNISMSMISYIENGERMPTMQTLIDYASHFSMEIKELIEIRIITLANTVKQHGEKTPHHIMNEYHLIAYFTSRRTVG